MTKTKPFHFLAHHSFVIKRALTPAFWIATLIFVTIYAIIAFEWLHSLHRSCQSGGDSHLRHDRSGVGLDAFRQVETRRC
jgi:hypothetical protein